MSTSRTGPLDDLDVLLTTLPGEATLGHRQAARLVITPAGAFVLVAEDGEVGPAAEQAHDLALATRSALSQHLSWVPFIDAAVVTHRRIHVEAATIVVPLDLLSEVLIKGPTMISHSAMLVMCRLLEAGSLWEWTVGKPPIAAKIDLCDPRSLTSSPVHR